MVKSDSGLHHMHKRKRIHQKLEPYPHPDKLKRALDKAIYPIAVIGPLLTIPQILKIWIGQNAVSISLFSWTAFTIPAAVWILYGIAHKEKAIILCNTAWILSYILVISGALLYG